MALAMAMMEPLGMPIRAKRAPALRLGFVPLLDCAPLVMAHELGLFEKYGLRVTLQRELGWATIRDKIIYRELEAAHALAAMPMAATLGLGSSACDCVTGLVLNLHGNAITLSNEMWEQGARDAATLRDFVRRSRRDKAFTFAAVGTVSSHFFLLREWLAEACINPERDVRIVIMPPPQMHTNLNAGHLDGFCVGEPWNSVAVEAGAGWCVATSAELAAGHPEKVLMARREFAEKRPAEHAALVAALLESCEFCAQAENHERVVATLARPQYVGVSESALRRGLSGEFDFGHGSTRRVQDFILFSGAGVNEPSADKAAWVLNHLRQAVPRFASATAGAALGRRVFRDDLYAEAVRLRSCKADPAAAVPVLVH
jgi:ABC-type nitrate/sulfonate/bicarbonate transport system substrate-binding protein